MTLSPTAKSLLVKVPAVTAIFWVIKILATTVGETFADAINNYLVDNFGMTDAQGLQVLSILMGAVLVVTLLIQIFGKKYVPAIYWVNVVFISIAGTLITDNLHDGLGVPLWVTTTVFAIALGAFFAVWFATEKTLAMKSITTKRREVFYWLAILLTFALGTSAGDQFSESLQLGYGFSLVIFAMLIGVFAILAKTDMISNVAGFWFIYILTRPLGASLGDLLSQKTKDGGLQLGTNKVSAVFFVLILLGVIYLSRTRKDEIKAD